MIKKLKTGFTLIELLVVISIIGILATLLIANLSGVRSRGRDAQRKSDVAQIQRALELYKGSQSPPSYPAGSWRNDLVSGDFMKIVPHDPMSASGWPDYFYTRDPEGSGDDLTYKLVACLENASDPHGETGDDKASYCSDQPASFTRTEP